jgi:hypothetical protein
MNTAKAMEATRTKVLFYLVLFKKTNDILIVKAKLEWD